MHSLTLLDISTDLSIYRVLSQLFNSLVLFYINLPSFLTRLSVSFYFNCLDTNSVFSFHFCPCRRTSGCCFPVMLFSLEFQPLTALLVLCLCLYFISRWEHSGSASIAGERNREIRSIYHSMEHLHDQKPTCRSQWPRGLRRRSTAARLLRSWIRIPPRAWMFVCCVLSSRGLCAELITRPEESYWLWCVWVWYRNLIYEGWNFNSGNYLFATDTK